MNDPLSSVRTRCDGIFHFRDGSTLAVPPQIAVAPRPTKSGHWRMQCDGRGWEVHPDEPRCFVEAAVKDLLRI